MPSYLRTDVSDMKIKLSASAFLLCVIIFISCVGQNNSALYPVPDESYFETEIRGRTIDTGKITETMNGITPNSIPEWLSAFFEGGIEAVESLNSYNGKYVFIGENKGENFNALNKWADNFSPVYDFPMLAAARVERRMILTSSLYPDDEYGLFFEKMVLNAYSGEYQGAVKEDIYWIKMKSENETDEYIFFILITINKTTMRTIFTNMMTLTFNAVTPSGAQASAVERLRQTFFEGF